MKHNWFTSTKRYFRKGVTVVLTASMLVGGSFSLSFNDGHYSLAKDSVVMAAAQSIQSMSYYSTNDGPILTASSTGAASYGFVMPVFNGGDLSYEDAASDLAVNVKVNGQWVDIGNVSDFVYSSNWGIWHDGGFSGYWFNVADTTNLQLVSKTNPNVSLEYTLQYNQLAKMEITSMNANGGNVLTANYVGGSGFTYPQFNGDSSIKYEQVADDLDTFVWSDESNSFIPLGNNPTSGWIYEKNFGQFWEGGGGFWFNIEKTTIVRLVSKSSPNVYVDYTINYPNTVRNNYIISADETTLRAGETGSVGIVLPKIDGGFPVNAEIDKYTYEIKVNGNWVALSDVAQSGFSYQSSGYNKLSDKNQWGYFADYVYGLWFQPIQEDMEIRIGYPLNGVKGGAIGTNYVYYNIIGNPNAVRPDVSDLGNITLGTSSDSQVENWNLIWNDEFSGNTLDTNKWDYNTGYYINSDPNTWGWGNGELEYYTSSTKNVFVQDGNLNLKAYYEPTTFEQDPNRVAPYSSGKIITKDNFTFKYGRIDFRAKLPAGNGLWPALWLLPNDDSYGTWAASGEIDVMEARGRVPEATSGAIHYGGTWPNNRSMGADFVFEDGQRFDTDFHVYSLVWEEDSLKWYVDGKCFYKATNEQWYSANSNGNKNAPFDQEFYIIMNLALGGWFDGGLNPNLEDLPATMQVDYVRVYQAEGSTDGSYTINYDENTETPQEPEAPATTDVAIGKSVTASGSENLVFGVENINDNNTGTRWASNFADDAWFVVDLGQTYNINQIKLNWEAAFGKKYEILVSTNGTNYTSVATQNDGQGGMETLNFSATSARYVKFQGIERALPYGYSLWDVQIMGR